MPINFKIINKGNSSINYIWVHANETTAEKTLLKHMNTNTGKAFFIDNPHNKREVLIEDMLIDPNRIFSSIGIIESLLSLNVNCSNNEHTEKINKIVFLIENKLKIYLPIIIPEHGKLLIAMHNNLDGYSIYDEVNDSDDLCLNDKENPNDFFLVNNLSDYNKLKNTAYNVLLQTKTRLDDGSLSCRISKEGRRYLNIEVRHGQTEKNYLMLDAAVKLLK